MTPCDTRRLACPETHRPSSRPGGALTKQPFVSPSWQRARPNVCVLYVFGQRHDSEPDTGKQGRPEGGRTFAALHRRARAEEEQLLTRYRELGVELEAVEERLGKIRAFVELFSQYTRPAAGQPLAKDLANMTIADASAAILRSLGGEARLTELIKTLRSVGKLPTSTRGAYSTLVQTLKRYPKIFEKTRAGVWKLVDEAPVAGDPGRPGPFVYSTPLSVGEFIVDGQAVPGHVLYKVGSGKSGAIYGFNPSQLVRMPPPLKVATVESFRAAMEAIKVKTTKNTAVNVSPDEAAKTNEEANGSPDPPD